MKLPLKFPSIVSRLQLVTRLRRLHLRSAKFVPFAIVSLFFLTNIMPVLVSQVMAPVENTTTMATIPTDIPSSGDCDLDWIIFRAGEKAGIDPRFIHAVIKQESRYDPKAVSSAGAQGLMQNDAGDSEALWSQRSV